MSIVTRFFQYLAESESQFLPVVASTESIDITPSPQRHEKIQEEINRVLLEIANTSPIEPDDASRQ